MEKTYFTTGNVKKFFSTETSSLPGNAAGLVKTLSKNYGEAAYAVAEGGGDFAQPIINEMVGSYAKSVSLIINGWAGNA